MNPVMLELYRAYKDEKDHGAANQLAGHFYRQLNYWIENGHPSAEFTEEFWELFSDIQGSLTSTTDLIDLGLMQTAEAITVYRQDEQTHSISDFYIYEARLPFFAFMDEGGYRLMKNIEFSEIDFHIYEIIQGDFPDEVAQSFLRENEWVDIWTALRYLDTLEEQETRFDILENMLEKRKTIQEQIIVLAYVFFAENDFDGNLNDEKEFSIPEVFDPIMINAVLRILEDFYTDGELKTSWEENVPVEYENEILFFLISFFEISQSEISPAWIRVLERGMNTIWTYPFPEMDGSVKIHQPIQEFTASIITLFNESELAQFLETSLAFPIFFENLNKYNNESFQQFLGAFTRREDLLLNELQFALPGNISQDQVKEVLEGRLQEIASYMGREIKVQNGIPLLRHSDGSIN